MSNQQPGASEPELDEVSDSGENGSRGVSAVEFGLLEQSSKTFRDSDRSSNPVLSASAEVN